MGGSHPSRSLRKALLAGLLLLVLVVLNAAVVVPAVHHLWHAGHGCDQPDCVVVALAHGKIDPTTAPLPSIGFVAAPFVLSEGVSVSVFVLKDCPPLPGRSPPV